MVINIKRAYEPAEEADGFRILVDRLWPRGISKEKAHLDLWLKEVGPSTELRKWFGHDPSLFEGFQEKYKEELKSAEAFQELKKVVAEHPKVTLVYSAHDAEYNNAVVLKSLLEQ